MQALHSSCAKRPGEMQACWRTAGYLAVASGRRHVGALLAVLTFPLCKLELVAMLELLMACYRADRFADMWGELFFRWQLQAPPVLTRESQRRALDLLSK